MKCILQTFNNFLTKTQCQPNLYLLLSSHNPLSKILKELSKYIYPFWRVFFSTFSTIAPIIIVIAIMMDTFITYIIVLVLIQSLNTIKELKINNKNNHLVQKLVKIITVIEMMSRVLIRMELVVSIYRYEKVHFSCFFLIEIIPFSVFRFNFRLILITISLYELGHMDAAAAKSSRSAATVVLLK